MEENKIKINSSKEGVLNILFPKEGENIRLFMEVYYKN